jgi:hypothetical protein
VQKANDYAANVSHYNADPNVKNSKDLDGNKDMARFRKAAKCWYHCNISMLEKQQQPRAFCTELV